MMHRSVLWMLAFFAAMLCPIMAQADGRGEKPRFNSETFCTFEQSLQEFVRYHSAEEITQLGQDLKFLNTVNSPYFDRRSAINMLNRNTTRKRFQDTLKIAATVCDTKTPFSTIQNLFRSLGPELDGRAHDELEELKKAAQARIVKIAAIKPEATFLRNAEKTCPFAHIAEEGTIVHIAGRGRFRDNEKLAALDPIFNKSSFEYNIKLTDLPASIHLVLEANNYGVWNLNIDDPARVKSVNHQ